MQLLIFFVPCNSKVAIKITLSHIDSLNIIPLSKDKVKHFLKVFLSFFKFFQLFLYLSKIAFFIPNQSVL